MSLDALIAGIGVHHLIASPDTVGDLVEVVSFGACHGDRVRQASTGIDIRCLKPVKAKDARRANYALSLSTPDASAGGQVVLDFTAV